MFGYLIADPKLLDEQSQSRYRSYYCGLCEALKKLHGEVGRLTLRYDMTFVALVLSNVYGSIEGSLSGRCAIHPFRKHSYVESETLDYAADMNVALAYHKCIDDIRDESSLGGRFGIRMLGKSYETVKKRWPRQCKAIEECLSEIYAAEKRGELNPDIPTDIFGRLMGEIFVMKEGKNENELRFFGEALGRSVYIMDAVTDLKSDLKHCRYNPVSGLSKEVREEVLESFMGECSQGFCGLNIVGDDKKILENVLYSGFWVRYDSLSKKKKEARTADG